MEMMTLTATLIVLTIDLKGGSGATASFASL